MEPTATLLLRTRQRAPTCRYDEPLTDMRVARAAGCSPAAARMAWISRAEDISPLQYNVIRCVVRTEPASQYGADEACGFPQPGAAFDPGERRLCSRDRASGFRVLRGGPGYDGTSHSPQQSAEVASAWLHDARPVRLPVSRLARPAHRRSPIRQRPHQRRAGRKPAAGRPAPPLKAPFTVQRRRLSRLPAQNFIRAPT